MASPITVFITGANTGLGLYTVKALYRSTVAYNVLLGARDLNKATAAIDEVKREYPDSASNIDTSITQAYEAISKKHDKIDVLLNNAGKEVF